MMETVFPMAPAGRRSDKGEEIPLQLPGIGQPFIEGKVASPVGDIPRMGAELSFRDRLGTIKARWAVGRMSFTLDPGLYALGSPDAASHVFVTANYKMSFDRLRAALKGISAWILVLDTRGINVWCAAGKGTLAPLHLSRSLRLLYQERY